MKIRHLFKHIEFAVRYTLNTTLYKENGTHRPLHKNRFISSGRLTVEILYLSKITPLDYMFYIIIRFIIVILRCFDRCKMSVVYG